MPPPRVEPPPEREPGEVLEEGEAPDDEDVEIVGSDSAAASMPRIINKLMYSYIPGVTETPSTIFTLLRCVPQ